MVGLQCKINTIYFEDSSNKPLTIVKVVTTFLLG